MSEFWRMGGYGAYVWSAYGITLAVLVLNVWAAKRAHRRSLRRLREAPAGREAGRKPTVRRV